MYLRHLSLGNRLSLKPSVGPTLAAVSSPSLGGLACSMREAVEKGHLLTQAEGGQVRLVGERVLATFLHTRTGSLSWFLVLLGLPLLILDSYTWLGGGLDAG